MKRLLTSAAMAFAVTIASFATPAVAKGDGNYAKADRELRKLLQIHYYSGRGITPAVRKAAGVSAVFDHRFGLFEPARCSFITYKGARALTCDSL